MHKTITAALVAIAAAGFIVTIAVFAHDYGRVPQVVATHFGPTGAPDAWGSKGTFVVFPLIGLFVLVLAAGIGTFGLPSNRGPVPPALPTITCAVFAETSWIMAITEIGSFQVALGNAATLNAGTLIAGLVVVMATTAVLLVIALSAAVRR